MKCPDCDYQFRYVDRRYAYRTVLKDKVIIEYRCEDCYKGFKDRLYRRFSTGKNRVE